VGENTAVQDEIIDAQQMDSNVVLEADALLRGCIEAKNLDTSASCQLPLYFVGLPLPHKNCLASVSTSLTQSRLG